MITTINAAFVSNKTAPVGSVKDMAWPALSAMLGNIQTGDKDGPAWLPADIEPGARTGERVKATTALVLDVEADTTKDQETGIKRIVGPDPIESDAMAAEVALFGWACILHTSYTHHDRSIEPVNQEHPRYRLVFQLSRPLEHAEIKPLGLHVAGLLGIVDCLDGGCLEPARLYYLPRCPAERLAEFRHAVIDGEPLDVDALLSATRREADALKRATTAKPGKQSGSVIEAFNQAHDIGAILEAHGYIAKGHNRWLHPDSTTGMPGVRKLPKTTPERVYSSHGGDPLNDGHAHDAFDVWRILKHGGDTTAATREAARVLGLSDGRQGVSAGDLPPPHSESEVSGVSGVQPSNGAASGETPAELHGVAGVAELMPGTGDRPCFRVFDDWHEHGGEKHRPGVWFFGVKPGKGEAPPALTESWVCSPLHIEAITFDGQDNNFGRLLRFRNTLNRWREWAMPMELLRGGGDDLRGELLAMGVEIDPAAKPLLANYLQAKPPKRRMRCALQVGWCDSSFVLPDKVIGPDASGVIFQSGERGHDEHTIAGTLEGWQAEIAARAVGNPLLLLALSASFAGPLLARCNAEGGGIHYVGDSSTGKTTAIEAACATWGGPNFRRSWRATANGMEGAAALFNDCLLALDEISECDPKEVGAIVYALGNGRGKQRASRTGQARGVVRWRCVVLSSGERTIATTMQEVGHRAKAGQSVRLLDIPASRTYGAWDTLHGMASGTAFSDAIKRAAATHHGHAGRAFLERLTRDNRDFCAFLQRIKDLREFSADGGEGQDKRAAGRFALFAMAGEVATEYGLTGWPEGAAIQAAAEGFNVWRGLRGHGNDERRQILDKVSGFIERHGDGRLSDADSDHETQTRDRAGWWSDSDGERTYLFTADGMREALKGFDFGRALDALQEAGALPAPGAGGKRAKLFRISGRPVKLYPINPDKLGGDHGA